MATELVFTATYCEQENIEAWVRGVHLHRPEADILVVDDSRLNRAVLCKLLSQSEHMLIEAAPRKIDRVQIDEVADGIKIPTLRTKARFC